MERDDVERLVRVEEGLRELRGDVQEMRSDLTELKGLCTQLAARPDLLGWLVAHRKAVLTVVGVVVSVAGGSAWIPALVEALGK